MRRTAFFLKKRPSFKIRFVFLKPCSIFASNSKFIFMKKIVFTLMMLFTLSIGYAQKYILVEELTGTWCQWCPRGIYYGDSLCGTYDNVIFVAIHCSDPMANDEYYQATGLVGAPSANIGRHFLAQETQNWFPKVEQESQIPSKVSMGITCNYDPESRQLTANISATAVEDMSGDYRFAAILIEDGVTGPAPSYNQTNSYSGGGHGPMGGYENLPNPIPANRIAYDHVGRQLLCDYPSHHQCRHPSQRIMNSPTLWTKPTITTTSASSAYSSPPTAPWKTQSKALISMGTRPLHPCSLQHPILRLTPTSIIFIMCISMTPTQATPTTISLYYKDQVG